MTVSKGWPTTRDRSPPAPPANRLAMGEALAASTLNSVGLTGCDHRHQSLVTGCAEEDKEVDELGEEEDEEPLELYSGDVSSAVKRRRRPARDTSPEYSSRGSESSSEPSESTSVSSEAHPVTRDWCRWSHPVRHTMETNYRRGAQLGNMSAINKYIRNPKISTLK